MRFLEAGAATAQVLQVYKMFPLARPMGRNAGNAGGEVWLDWRRQPWQPGETVPFRKDLIAV